VISFEQLYSVPAWLAGSGPQADIVISTRVRLARNLAYHQFPHRASLKERKDVFEKVVAACRKIPRCKGYNVSNFTSQSPLNQQYLVEERVVSPDLLAVEGDRGVITDPGRSVAIMVNEEDHIRLSSMGSGYCAETLWEALDSVDTALGRRIPFAFDTQRGFLTCCPTNSGTGLRVSFLMHLPGLALTKTIDQTLQAASQMGISTRGFFGEHSEIVGNLFQLSNQATMGACEDEFLSGTQAMITQIDALERKARERVLADARTELADKVMRAYGILRYARTLNVAEYLNLSSALRLGIECGLLGGLSVSDLNRLTLLVLPAHIQTLYDRSMDEDELQRIRAEMVRNLTEQKTEAA
jgi:protein arginine kinase